MSDIDLLLESARYPELNSSDKATMKVLLQNTLDEHQRLMNEGTLTGDVAQFTPILLPLVRSVYPNLIANEILGVQSMPLPTGYIYALVNRYTGAEGAVSPTDSAVVVSVEWETGKVPADAGATVTVTSGGKEFAVAHAEERHLLLVSTTGEAVVGDVLKAGGDDIATITGVYTNEAAFSRILKNYTGSYTTAQGEKLGKDMKEIGFSIAQKNISVKTRALKGQYSVEMYEDLKRQHGLLADEEIMSLMSYEMQAEIDRECVDFVNNNATQLANTISFSANPRNSMSGRWEIEKYRREVIRIDREAAQIGLDTKRSQGNVLLVSPGVATMLEQVGTFKDAPVASSVSAPVSGGVAGVYNNKYKVIVDQYATDDYATVMYKGADRRDAMGFFAPYVPISFTKVTHADSGQPAIIAKTRYALDTIPGIASAESNDRAKRYARSFGVDLTNTALSQSVEVE